MWHPISGIDPAIETYDLMLRYCCHILWGLIFIRYLNLFFSHG